ncbi:MAG: peptidylprolyl isomerase, partial [Neisseriaceae bacterium]|nr:peptidylprolyl isomerase [Neisseriaceae bacterium]
MIRLTTNFGNIDIELNFDKAPKTAANFEQYVKDGFYNGTIFHRVIDNFMIQAGDPKSKGAAAGTQLGTGGPGYTIPAEFNPNLIHKKGAVAAARLGGPQNPKKESSGSQFYIVVGQTVPAEQLDAMAAHKAEQAKGEYIQSQLYKPENKEHLNELIQLQQIGDRQKFMEKWNAFGELYKDSLANIQTLSYTDEQKNIYSTIGGTPHLDMDYTVFGEVIDGLAVVDSIAKVKKDRYDRPLNDVIIT